MYRQYSELMFMCSKYQFVCFLNTCKLFRFTNKIFKTKQRQYEHIFSVEKDKSSTLFNIRSLLFEHQQQHFMQMRNPGSNVTAN